MMLHKHALLTNKSHWACSLFDYIRQNWKITKNNKKDDEQKSLGEKFKDQDSLTGTGNLC